MLRKTLSAVAFITAVAWLAGPVEVPSAWAEETVVKVRAITSESSDSAKADEESGHVSLKNLVQELMDARANYGENLHRLVDFYDKNANGERRSWAKRELNEFRKINQRDYLPDLQARIVVVAVENSGESDIVEALLKCRENYRERLESLVEVLAKAKEVSRWQKAKRELRELISVNKYLYLRDADTPSHDLRPAKKISEADKLYEQSLKIKNASKIIFTDRYRTQLAMEGFRQLIRDYPNSDKIDEAAYQIGEICRDGLKDYQRAIRWYECVLAWDPDTQLPVNYRIARIYDRRVVNRLAALNYYRRALEQIPSDSPRHKEIQDRIDKLRGK